jgi:hypothetical protein
MVGTGCSPAGCCSGSLGIGISAYHHFARLRWLDALANASIDSRSEWARSIPIRTGRGKNGSPRSTALYSGIILLGPRGRVLAAIHRFLQSLHLVVAEGEES